MSNWINKKPTHTNWVIAYVPSYCESQYQIARFIDGSWESDGGDELTGYVEGWSDFEKFSEGENTSKEITLYTALRELLVVDDVFVEYNKLGSVEGWPEIEGESLDTENCSVVDITRNKIIIFAGGDWQEAQNVRIELIDNKLKVTKFNAASAPETPMTEDEILEKLEAEI